jgi:hypothetical protein
MPEEKQQRKGHTSIRNPETSLPWGLAGCYVGSDLAREQRTNGKPWREQVGGIARWMELAHQLVRPDFGRDWVMDWHTLAHLLATPSILQPPRTQ